MDLGGASAWRMRSFIAMGHDATRIARTGSRSTCVLNGDRFMATDVLTEPCSQDLARTLLKAGPDKRA